MRVGVMPVVNGITDVASRLSAIDSILLARDRSQGLIEQPFPPISGS